MNNLNAKQNIYYTQVNANEVIEWSKNPVPIDEYRTQSCRTTTPRPCASLGVCPITAEHNDVSNYRVGASFYSREKVKVKEGDVLPFVTTLVRSS